MRVTFAFLSMLAAASFSTAEAPKSNPNCSCAACGCVACDCVGSDFLCKCPNCMASKPLSYEDAQAKAIADNKPISVGVGVNGGDMRADWYADCGYAKGMHFFYPSGGKMYYAGTAWPVRRMACNGQTCSLEWQPAPGVYPALSRGTGDCSTGSCGMSATRGGFRTVQGGSSCASGSCGR